MHTVQKVAFRRCFLHPAREAAAVCPECGRYFCRECVTEHDDRVLCASCIRKLHRPPFARRYRLHDLARGAQALFGFMLLLLFFYYLGQALLMVPSTFHEGGVWDHAWWTGK